MKAVIGVVLVAVLALGVGTPLFGNLLMLLMDRDNFIPAESSLLSFEPYQVSQGSSNYWLYGEDDRYYYHFTHEPTHPYRYIAKDNHCPAFDRDDVRSWCNALQGTLPK
ncbi:MULTISPECIES: hypothetical protein [Pseudomonas]|jgi:hypothetical protein|uniref:Uncharacterized protein n=1 Tax=Pseudomonas qingdaonensis TaxID=2056231 RepID=A0ABX8DS91_9PSED|nr:MULTISPECIES: hypothetical protein [Pseudomonas]KTC17609.1 hypothetical protein AO392_09455 [Pseudomonas putida]MBG8558393.1 hypothetical protein [Pseudomonas qingdaonensis]MEC6744838.1 hypothetical protein [Pseudomonas qingdaonensis]PPS59598.1 hypothetical protein CR917_01000 [Pseudomonas sp. BRM28]QVL18899.1 hypothetical protein KH389_26680 [Pseudomonas qingdaonensis]